jgi:hypothetical protein
MNLAIPFIAAGALAALGALRQVTHNGSDSGSLNPSPRQALATLEPSNNRSQASFMLKPA